MAVPLYPGPGVYPSPSLWPGSRGGTVYVPGDPIFTGPLDLYNQAIRSGSFALTYTVDASLGGAPIAGGTGLRPTGGNITDTTKPGVRRVLNLNLAPSPGLFDALSPIGTRLRVTGHVRYTNRTVVDVPMGVFEVDSETLSEGGGGLSLTAPDKWVRIKRARFVRPQASQPNVPVTEQIASLIKGALGESETVTITATSQAVMGPLTWEKDRDTAILDLAASIGAWVYFDRFGVATVADLPTAGNAATWLVDASTSGVLISLDRERSRTSASNVVVVESSSTDEAPFTTQIVWDSDPSSPTYAGPDPVNHPELAGPFGVVTYYHDTPLPLTDAGAKSAGFTILARESGLSSQVSLSQTPNPAVDAFDTIDVLPPRERYDMGRVLERHIVDTVTHPLGLGALTIDGRELREVR